MLNACKTNKQTDKNGINANIFNKYALRGWENIRVALLPKAEQNVLLD